MIRKTIAFTLAETLIVMGIIGVVSALTLPNLNSSTGEKEKVAKVKKIYQNLDDALGRAQAVYGPFDEWKLNDSNTTSQITRIGERITEFMKVSKNCGTAVNKGCISNKNILYLAVSESDSFNDADSSIYKIILSDGTSVIFYLSSGIIIDIDGPNKGTNTYGKDIFKFRVAENNNIIPMKPDSFSEYFSQSEGFLNSGEYASGWVIDYDNMDYLKLNSGGKCPNGTTPTEQNPKCK